MKIKGPFPISTYFQYKGKKNYGHFYIWMIYYLKTFLLASKDTSLRFFIFYLISAALCTVYSPFYVPLLLGDIINRVDNFKFVLKSVIRSGA